MYMYGVAWVSDILVTLGTRWTAYILHLYKTKNVFLYNSKKGTQCLI